MLFQSSDDYYYYIQIVYVFQAKESFSFSIEWIEFVLMAITNEENDE